jgi:serine/threonine-protein kinase
VALKILNRELTRSPNRLAQFRHEAERGARLAGPSLLRVFEHGQIDHFLFMTMPLIEGTTLQEVIRQRRARLPGPPPEPSYRPSSLDEGLYLCSAVRILAAAARALSRLHACRVVHRDIKPSNILLDCRKGCDVYLCDLGLGRDLEYATPQQMCDGAGTPMYMAPERLLKAPADEMLCDIYSLGVTLFESVTLERPFHPPDSLPATCLPLYLATAQPRHPRVLDPALPAELEAIILKAMARDPLQRFQSAEDLADALDQLAANWPAREVSPGGHPAHQLPAEPHGARVPRSPIAFAASG